MTIKIGHKPLYPPVLLAPMAGITDLPFRNLVQRFGAGLVVSEMVSSQEMVQAKPGVRERAELGPETNAELGSELGSELGPELGLGRAGTSVQLAGRDPYWIAEAARIVAANGAQIIDINMGCPAKKVVNGYSGSALMKDPDHALRLIDAVISAVDIPVTLKTRLGWDDKMLNAADIAKRAEDSGIAMVTIHGRTRCQFYKGQADWRAINAVKRAVSIPVIANGDIVSIETARMAMAQSGADGVMVGRGAQGRPWFLAQIGAALFGTAPPKIPQGAEFVDMVTGHYQEMLSFYGADLGGRVARKHLGWYMDSVGTAREQRRQVLTATPKDVPFLLKSALAPCENGQVVA